MATPRQEQYNGYTIQPRSDLRNADLRNLVLRGASLASSDLRGADLRNTDLTFANCYGCDFRGADLRGTQFIKTVLHTSQFQDAKFGNTNMFNAKAHDCNFRGVTFGPNTTLENATVYRSMFTGGNIDNLILTNTRMNWAILRNMDLRNSSIGAANIQAADFANSNLSGMDLSNWDMDGAIFKSADLRNITIDGFIGQYLTFDYSNLQDARITNNTLHSRVSFNFVNALRVDFSNSYFNVNSEFESGDFRFTNWDGANIRESWSRASDFSGSSFVRTGMRGARLQGCNMQDCTINESNLREADLRTANLRGTTLSNMNTVAISMNDVNFNETYLVGSTFTDVDICGAYTWDNAIKRERNPETGSMEFARLINVTGPDCYLYFAERTPPTGPI